MPVTSKIIASIIFILAAFVAEVSVIANILDFNDQKFLGATISFLPVVGVAGLFGWLFSRRITKNDSNIILNNPLIIGVIVTLLSLVVGGAIAGTLISNQNATFIEKIYYGAISAVFWASFLSYGVVYLIGGIAGYLVYYVNNKLVLSRLNIER